MERIIEPRYGCETYVGQNGHVCIKQYRDREGEQLIILHREEAQALLGLIENAIQEALDFTPDLKDEEEHATN